MIDPCQNELRQPHFSADNKNNLIGHRKKYLGDGIWESSNRGEFYDPSEDQWIEASPIDGKERNSHAMALLPNGLLLLLNGFSYRGGQSRVRR